MKPYQLLAGMAVCAGLALTSCIDDAYDLDDIDTTVRVGVDKLVIPINIDEISLSSIIDVTSEIQVVDDEYAYVTDGTFDSDPIEINGFDVHIDPIDPVSATIKDAGSPMAGYDITFVLSDMEPSDYSFLASNVSKDIDEIYTAYARTTITFNVDMTSLKDITDMVHMTDVRLQLPANMMVESSEAGVYDAATGIYTINEYDCDTSKPDDIKLVVNGLSELADWYDSDTRTFVYSGQIGMLGGTFSIKTSKASETLQNYDISVTAIIPGFSVASIDGVIRYAIDNVNIPKVNLNSIPDILSQPGTSLAFANPCLYLSTTNPLQEYGIKASTGLEIVALRPGQPSKTFRADDESFIIGNAAPDGDKYQFCLSPAMPSQLDAAYPKAEHVPFSQLGNVLAGNGLPKEIEVDLVEPQIYPQRVDKFRLGTSYAGVNGSYKFIAPFNLSKGSQIVYSDIVDGWSDDDLDKLTITHLEVRADITTDIPVGVKFTGYPLGKDGQRLAGVSITGAEVGANANSQTVTIVVEGTIQNLDGIEFEAVATADGGVLRPSSTIKLANIRPCVSGYYQDEL